MQTQTRTEELIHAANVFRHEACETGDPLHDAFADLVLYRVEQVERAQLARAVEAIPDEPCGYVIEPDPLDAPIEFCDRYVVSRDVPELALRALDVLDRKAG